MRGAPHHQDWRVTFLLVLIAASMLVMLPGGTASQSGPENLGGMLAAGLPVGHDVCGLARLSHRSPTAVPTFMAAGCAPVFVLRYVVGGA